MIIDGLVSGGVAVGIAVAGAAVGAAINGASGALVGGFTAYFVGGAWSTYYQFNGLTRGHTLGRQSSNYYIANENGSSLSLSTAILRALVSILSSMVLYIGWFAPFWNPKRQTWHDQLVGTVAIVGTKPNVRSSIGRGIAVAAVIALALAALTASLWGDDIDFESDLRAGVAWDGTRTDAARIPGSIAAANYLDYCDEEFYVSEPEVRFDGDVQILFIDFQNRCDLTAVLDDWSFTTSWSSSQCNVAHSFDFSTTPLVIAPWDDFGVELHMPRSECGDEVIDPHWDAELSFEDSMLPTTGPDIVTAAPR